LSTLLGCLLGVFLLLFSDESSAFYVGILIFGNILFPTLLGVLLFQLVKRWVTFRSLTKTLVVRILVLVLLFAIGLVLWAIGDVALSGLTIEKVVDDFNSQFLGFTPIALCLAISIPAFDLLLSGNKK
jgi:hypothetical protein